MVCLLKVVNIHPPLSSSVSNWVPRSKIWTWEWTKCPGQRDLGWETDSSSSCKSIHNPQVSKSLIRKFCNFKNLKKATCSVCELMLPGSKKLRHAQGSWQLSVEHSKRCALGFDSNCRCLSHIAWGLMEKLLASVDISHAFTPPAADIAAPNELALTPLHMPDHMCVITTATAQEVAAISTLWRSVAFSSLCPWNPEFLILYTVIRRLVNVEQIVLANGDIPLILFSPAHFPLYFVWDLDTVFILIFQQMANLLKRWHSFPACFHSTGARNSMTATVNWHQLGDSLPSSFTVM